MKQLNVETSESVFSPQTPLLIVYVCVGGEGELGGWFGRGHPVNDSIGNSLTRENNQNL